jgi:hypothetical protein
VNLNRKKALIVSYYLSKYDRRALNTLSYVSFRQAFREIGAKLEIPPNTIKNRRDDFDSINENNRSGWYQKELSKSSLEIVDIYGAMSEDALTEIVKDIIFFQDNKTDYLPDLFENKNNSISHSYNNRGVTGKQAENLFVQFFKDGLFNKFNGDLVDTRDDGCGYDFKLSGKSEMVFEIKGLASHEGGISLTDKEWSIAKKLKSNYILVIISNVFSNPTLKVIENPYEKIKPVKRFSKVVSINWSIHTKEL